MAGHSITMGDGTRAFIDYEDGEGSAVVNGRLWRWHYHRFLGPSFLRNDGELRACQNPTIKAVWDAFMDWLERGEKENPR